MERPEFSNRQLLLLLWIQVTVFWVYMFVATPTNVLVAYQKF